MLKQKTVSQSMEDERPAKRMKRIIPEGAAVAVAFKDVPDWHPMGRIENSICCRLSCHLLQVHNRNFIVRMQNPEHQDFRKQYESVSEQFFKLHDLRGDELEHARKMYKDQTWLMVHDMLRRWLRPYCGFSTRNALTRLRTESELLYKAVTAIFPDADQGLAYWTAKEVDKLHEIVASAPAEMQQTPSLLELVHHAENVCVQRICFGVYCDYRHLERKEADEHYALPARLIGRDRVSVTQSVVHRMAPWLREPYDAAIAAMGINTV